TRRRAAGLRDNPRSHRVGGRATPPDRSAPPPLTPLPRRGRHGQRALQPAPTCGRPAPGPPRHPGQGAPGQLHATARRPHTGRRAPPLLPRPGAGPGRRVAFCFRKSVEALVALFGLIRTGAAYVPIDPTWPRQRQETICREAGIDLWVGNVAPPPDTVRSALD